MQDWTLKYEVARVYNAGLNNDGPLMFFIEAYVNKVQTCIYNGKFS